MTHPAELKQIPVARPFLGEEEAAAAGRVIRSGWVTQGPEVAAFEAEFAAYVGAPHACAVANCTVALMLALKAFNIGPGDEVVTVSHSFIATANSVRHVGATPVFVDVDAATFNIDPSLVERVITDRTRALMVVHQVGQPCDLNALVPLARHYRLPLIEDAACAVGSEIHFDSQWQKIGRPHGDIACFSFHPRKLLTTGDGGMLTTSSAALDAKFRLWRQHAMSVSDAARHAASQVTFEEYLEVGYNFRMTDIQAAIGREQLRKIPAMVARRRQQVVRYQGLLSGMEALAAAQEPAWSRSNWQSFLVRLSPDIEQRRIMQELLSKGIATRRGIQCAHLEPAYPAATWSCGDPNCVAPCARLRRSQDCRDHSLLLPLYHDMSHEDQDRVVTALQQAVRSALVER